ncbi:MAG: Heme/hemopexin transporter protein HuxB [Candidatus Anoxychlamydiales bacterium]|nr:Heme/hemopexin transporter protein HuxB [Candidatus Anoxychlamydiales bacterium]
MFSVSASTWLFIHLVVNFVFNDFIVNEERPLASQESVDAKKEIVINNKLEDVQENYQIKNKSIDTFNVKNSFQVKQPLDSLGLFLTSKEKKIDTHNFFCNAGNVLAELEKPSKKNREHNESKDSIEYTNFDKRTIEGIYISGPNEELDKVENIKGITVENLCLPTFYKTFHDRLKGFLCCELNEKIIEDIKQTILNYYQDNFHPFVIVSLPEQKIQNNVIKIIVYESTACDISIKGNKYFSEKNIQNYISLKPNKSIDTQSIMQDLYWINRNPFRNASIVFSPGNKENTTDLEYFIDDRYPFRAYVGAENTGFEATEKERLIAGFNWGNAWGLDHIVTFQYTASSNINRFQAFTASYALPIFGKRILTLYGGYAQFKPKKTIKDLKNEGRSVQFSARYTFPIKPIKHYLHDLSIGFDYKRENINLTYRQRPFIGNSVNITQLVCDYNGRYELGNFNIPVEIIFVLSPGDIMEKQSNQRFSELRPHAKNSYFYSMQKITPIFKLPKDYELVINYTSQFSSNNLLSSEQLGLGGYNTVRGYEYRIVNKDNGVIFNIEGYTCPMKLISNRKIKFKESLKFLAFIDYGCGWDSTEIETVKDFIYLMGAGGGVRYQTFPNLAFRIDWGFKLHEIKEFEPRNKLGRWHFGFNLNF